MNPRVRGRTVYPGELPRVEDGDPARARKNLLHERAGALVER